MKVKGGGHRIHELLVDIYNHVQSSSDYNSVTSSSGKSGKCFGVDGESLKEKDIDELLSIIGCLKIHVERTGSVLVRQLKRRDALRRQQDAYNDVISKQLEKYGTDDTNDENARFSIQPAYGGESGFSQWAAGMKKVAELSGGIPPEFRRRLWLTLADRHLNARGVNWQTVERNCFSEWSHPTDAELGVQIVKDLHRTGCSLFCGEDGQENQALLKKVLLAYARWNKAVGYCQGFNMLAALILQVTDKCETDALKLMIYLIEGVLPESYFADSLRGLSIDMAVFRELLRTRLPNLSQHLDKLQNQAKDGTTSYEPPLTNVFTMQWFLTLFCNCLPQPTVLRVWDLILLEGNEILLRTALAIWQQLTKRILIVRSADEFYSTMGTLMGKLLYSNLIDANQLIESVVKIGQLNELKSLREHYLYNINPWGGGGGGGTTTTTAVNNNNKQLKVCYPKEKLVLDISVLKKQYVKLKQRQRQAHIIFSAAISRQPPPNTTPVAMNHLLLGKSALVPAKRLGPPKGSVPPARSVASPSTLHWKDTERDDGSSSSSSDTELCDDGDGELSDLDSDSKNLTETDNPIKTNFDNIDDENVTSSAIEDNLSLERAQKTTFSDIFDTNNQSTSKNDENTFNFYDDVDDAEGSDFEKFLEDRVRCLKEINSPPPPLAAAATTIEDETNQERELKFPRRNSERALQIIQENSLILHRIMQCQSRLSPSPPIAEGKCSEEDNKSVGRGEGSVSRDLSDENVDKPTYFYDLAASKIDDNSTNGTDADALSSSPSRDFVLKDDKKSRETTDLWIDSNELKLQGFATTPPSPSETAIEEDNKIVSGGGQGIYDFASKITNRADADVLSTSPSTDFVLKDVKNDEKVSRETTDLWIDSNELKLEGFATTPPPETATEIKDDNKSVSRGGGEGIYDFASKIDDSTNVSSPSTFLVPKDHKNDDKILDVSRETAENAWINSDEFKLETTAPLKTAIEIEEDNKSVSRGIERIYDFASKIDDSTNSAADVLSSSPSPSTDFVPQDAKNHDRFLEISKETPDHPQIELESFAKTATIEKESKLDLGIDNVPEYGSKYSSILEKSRNLDERYNSLIGNNASALQQFEFKSLNQTNREQNVNELIQMPNTNKHSLSYPTIKSSDNDDQQKMSSSEFLLNRSLELVDSSRADHSTSKSPNKIFNPFPRPLSSRQNKEVALRLGLYKKS